jgi:putative addiction module component (TIGR02574 family)
MNELLAKVLQLPTAERATIARELLLSLEPDEFDVDAEAAWAKEIDARLTAIEQDRFSARDWREAVENIRQSLSQGSSQ